jgi:hypothetical protein
MRENSIAQLYVDPARSDDAVVGSSRERKVIHAASILVIQPHIELAAQWRAELIDFGMFGVQSAASIDQALEAIKQQSFIGIVVSANTVAEASVAIQRLRPNGEPELTEDGVEIPLLLVLSNPARANEIAARRLGYEAILPAPVHSRLIYRRMGSLMQKARRSLRVRGVPTQGGDFAIKVSASADD